MPEFAGMGLTEEAAKKKGIDYGVGNFAMFANGGVGEIKILFGKKYNEILGVHILGLRATDMIGEAAPAIGLGAKRAIHSPNK